MALKPRIKKLLEELNEGVYEKEEVTALTLLTALAGESIFLLGAPGVAKSLLARRLKFAFTGGSSFEYLMNRFSTPDEIFGPVSISKLKDEDKYERIVTNYLPSATVVFLDEVWKAGPSIQNALLTVLNEKIYRNGDHEIHVPMKALISASNELPMKGEGLEALWDRFLVRYLVGSIESRKKFNDMISKELRSYDDNISPEGKITEEHYTVITSAIEKIDVPEEIFNIIHTIRIKLEAYNEAQKKENNENLIYISDRRWRKIIRLLRTSALLNDRTSVDLMDCFLITHCIWNETNQRKAVIDIINETIKEQGYIFAINLNDLQNELAEFNEDVMRGCSFVKQIKFAEPKLYYDKYYKLHSTFGGSFNGTFDLILQKDFNRLKEEPIMINIYCDSGNSGDADKPKRYPLSKSKDGDAVVSEKRTIKVTLELKQTPKTYSMKPLTPEQKKFMERYNFFLSTTTDMKKQIEQSRERDVPHFKSNLFVNPSFAEVAEASRKNAIKEIEKMEVEAERIRYYWENAQDEKDKEEANATG